MLLMMSWGDDYDGNGERGRTGRRDVNASVFRCLVIVVVAVNAVAATTTFTDDVCCGTPTIQLMCHALYCTCSRPQGSLSYSSYLLETPFSP